MVGVKMVSFSKPLAPPSAEPIENSIGHVEQPGAKGEKQSLDKRQMKMHGADKEPRPDSSHGRRIQAKKMPPSREVVEALGQDSVYENFHLPRVGVDTFHTPTNGVATHRSTKPLRLIYEVYLSSFPSYLVTHAVWTRSSH